MNVRKVVGPLDQIFASIFWFSCRVKPTFAIIETSNSFIEATIDRIGPERH